MDGSCIAQIFPSKKLNALAHTIHANIHTVINIIHTHTHTHTHTRIMVHLDLWKCLLKKESFELGYEVREGGEIPHAGRQWIQDSWSNETERTVANRFEAAFRDFQEIFVRISEALQPFYAPSYITTEFDLVCLSMLKCSNYEIRSLNC